MSTGKFYIAGAGLSGLAAAVALARAGIACELFEAAPQAGGRCRSWFDAQFGDSIDNGNHLVLSGNRATFAYLSAIGAHDRLAGPAGAEFAFCDVRKGTRWMLAPNLGALPWWVLSRSRRVPDTRVRDYARYVRLLSPPPDARVRDVVACDGPVWELLLRPLLLAALNMAPEDASAALASATLRETLARGGRFCLPRIASPNLAAAFVEPALAAVARAGGTVHLGARVRAVTLDERSAAAIDLGDSHVVLAPHDRLVLAVPPSVAASLLPGLVVPEQSSAIVNGHFRARAPAGAPSMMGVVGGTAEWLFAFPGRISVTVSGADGIVDHDRAELAALLWHDVAAAFDLPPELPVWQIVKEKRATFRATPEQCAKRPAAHTRWTNVFLAGDWTATGLPATIEGAIRSGETAVALALA